MGPYSAYKASTACAQAKGVCTPCSSRELRLALSTTYLVPSLHT